MATLPITTVLRPATDGTGQEGFSKNGVWNETDPFLGLVPPVGGAGLIFDYQLQFDSESRAIDPPVVGTLVLRVNLFSLASVQGILHVSYVPEINPANYSTALLPDTRDEIEIGSNAVTTLANQNTQAFVRLGTLVTPTIGDSVWDLTTVQQRIRDSRWQGRIAVTVTWEVVTGTTTLLSSREPTNAIHPQLVSGEAGFWTGVSNHPIDRGRSVRDMRTGLPITTDDLIEDGFTPGIWTEASQVDSDDPRNVRPTHLPDSEGEPGDDVPVV